MTDSIADFLTRLRNAIAAKHRVVEIPASNLKKEICKILFEKGYIMNYKFIDPGLRKYVGYKDMPRVLNGLGIAILSTSRGVMTDKEAAAQKVGGEVLCYIY